MSINSTAIQAKTEVNRKTKENTKNNLTGNSKTKDNDNEDHDSKNKAEKEEGLSICPSKDGLLVLMTCPLYESDKENIRMEVRVKFGSGAYVTNIYGKIKESLKDLYLFLTTTNTESPNKPLTKLAFYEYPIPDLNGYLNYYSEFDEEDVSILATALSQTKTLTSLDLSFLEEDHIAKILAALKFNHSIIKLKLPQIECKATLEQLLEQRRMDSLDIAFMGDYYTTLLQNALRSIRNSSLTSLSLRLSKNSNLKMPDTKTEIVKVDAPLRKLEKIFNSDNSNETAITTLSSLTIQYDMPLMGFNTEVPIENLNPITKFTFISTLILSGSDHRFRNLSVALQDLAQLKDLKHLELLGITFSKNEVNTVFDTLPNWSNSLTKFAFYLPFFIDAPDTSRIVNAIAKLPKLNDLGLSARLLGTDPKRKDVDDDLAGYTALANLLRNKITSLTSLYISGPKKTEIAIVENAIEHNHSLVSLNDSLDSGHVFQASSVESSSRICAILERNRRNQLSWFKIAPTVAFVRANQMYAPAFVRSIIPMFQNPNMPDIPRLAGFAPQVK